MFGAIAGDVIGSVHERSGLKSTAFDLFSAGSRCTDDTVLTVALAHALLDGADLATTLRAYHARYPGAGFGPTFRAWVQATPGSPAPRRDSNGALMRIAPVGWACRTLHEVLATAHRCTTVTHDHPEAVRGAQAVATAVFLARQGLHRAGLQARIERDFGYDLSVPLEHLRPVHAFTLACEATVVGALRSFLEADGFEAAVRNAVSLGGDADTLAAVAGAVAEAHEGGVPEAIAQATWDRLDAAMRTVVLRFARAHGVPLRVA